MIEILDYLQKHKTAVIAVLVMVLCLFVSGAVSKSFATKTAAAESSLHDVENKISNVQDLLKQPNIKYKELDHGYKKNRVDRDTEIIIGAGTGNGSTNEWLSRFLSWNSGTEYTENRNWFVEKLGAQNIFCTEIMRDYDTNVSMSETGSVNDPNKIQCILDVEKTKKSVYVNSINEDTGVYEYVIFAYYNGKAAYENQSFTGMDKVQCYIITVSIDKDGNVLPDTFVVSAGPTSTI